MSDVCFTCILPDCDPDHRDCAYRKTPEYLHRIELWRKQGARKRERSRRMKKSAEFLEQNGEKIRLLSKLHRAHILWDQGHDTAEISNLLNVQESVIYNEILPKILKRKAAA